MTDKITFANFVASQFELRQSFKMLKQEKDLHVWDTDAAEAICQNARVAHISIKAEPHTGNQSRIRWDIMYVILRYKIKEHKSQLGKRK